MAWVELNGVRTPYESWPDSRKMRLEQIFRAILTDEHDLGIACPANPVLTGRLTQREAEDLYLVHVAHALILESQRRVPWRLWALPPAERAVMLAPEHYVMRVAHRGETPYFKLPPTEDNVRALDCDPRVGFKFMAGLLEGSSAPLLGPTEEETLSRLSAWFRDDVGHGDYSYEELAVHAHLADRLARYSSIARPSLTAYWAIMGCHSAAVTFADLARAVNIPLLRVTRGDAPETVSGHAGLVFRWARVGTRVLQHADDIYAKSYVVFPLASDGRSASPEEADRQFFETNWPSVQTLRDRGFDFALVHLVPEPGSFWYGAADTLGWSIGAWRRGESTSRSDYELELQDALLKQFDIGGQQPMRNFCAFNWGSHSTDLWDTYVTDNGGRPTTRPITGAAFAARMQAMIDAHGGCAAVLRKISDAEAFKARPL